MDKLQANISIPQGEKITQQDLLDNCIEFVDKDFKTFVAEEIASHQLTKEKVQLILKSGVKSKHRHPEKAHDELLYGK